MDHYIDVLLLPDPELPLPILMNALFSKFHKALCELHATDIGVSFPKQGPTLGNLMRIHGTSTLLIKLQQLNWIGPLAGYCQIGDILQIPPQVKYCSVFRKQPNMSPAKLRRLIKRGSIAEDETNRYHSKMISTGLEEPYLELTSCSTGHRHRRYIAFGPLQDKLVEGNFDQFGLSSTATVPWF
ncbi:type I-F CRISPR-associated endoribonuclease Cas6/Csy4 [Desulfobacter sp.]|uniref:type I-F CRISPR-associated endoribonuclease Cas6/Csy4 n=1 Tax=Desulfobacter sp. TaxID=2294 RepID=UPI003D1002B4